MQTPTISKKEQSKTLSGKKKKKEVIKNVIQKPYQSFWPSLTPEDNSQLIEVLKKNLPRMIPNKVSVPYEKIKKVPKSERKQFRNSFNDSNVVRNKNLIFGVNDASKLLENQEAASVMIASDVQPRYFVQHILDQAVLYRVPAVVVTDLKKVCLEKCGLSGSVVALRKSISDSELEIIHQNICTLSENYPIPKDHINYQRQLELSTYTISDSEQECSDLLENKKDLDESEVKNCHLKRQGPKRTFVPEAVVEVKAPVAFFNLVTPVKDLTEGRGNKRKSQVRYWNLKVKRSKGDKDRSKNKLKKIKMKKK